MPTATPPFRLSPRALVTFSNRKPVRCSSFNPRNCHRTSGISSVSLLIGMVTRRSSFCWSSFCRCVRRSCRLLFTWVRSSIVASLLAGRLAVLGGALAGLVIFALHRPFRFLAVAVGPVAELVAVPRHTRRELGQLQLF